MDPIFRTLFIFVGVLVVVFLGVWYWYSQKRNRYTDDESGLTQLGVRIAYADRTISFGEKTYGVDQVQAVRLAERSEQDIGTSSNRKISAPGVYLDFEVLGTIGLTEFTDSGMPLEMARAMQAAQEQAGRPATSVLQFAYRVPTEAQGQAALQRFRAALQKAGANAFR